MSDSCDRAFLFLQGPHGPFFRHLANALKGQGATVCRIAFNRGDESEWGRAGPLYRFDGDLATYAEWLDSFLREHGITDIVLYGDTRPVHRMARERAGALGLTTHCFEEGYIRPSWITYERAGNSGNSRLMDISLPRMMAALGESVPPGESVPAIWGNHRHHLWHSFRYHMRCLLPARRYGQFPGHRELPLWRESAWYVARSLKIPWIRLYRAYRRGRLLRSAKRFHLALLQLSFDTSMQAHSDFHTSAEFVERVIGAFAKGAEPRDHLVFKAHPFEDGRERLGRVIRRLAREHDIAGRVIFIDGGSKLAALLDRASSAITINSTSAQQALWRGLPVAALGRAIYAKPGLVSAQPLTEFMHRPAPPDMRAYWVFRRFLMETSQVAGSFYTMPGIDRLLGRLPTLMLDRIDPYDRVLAQEAEPVAKTPTGAVLSARSA